jgi:hypothetical protein
MLYGAISTLLERKSTLSPSLTSPSASFRCEPKALFIPQKREAKRAFFGANRNER